MYHYTKRFVEIFTFANRFSFESIYTPTNAKSSISVESAKNKRPIQWFHKSTINEVSSRHLKLLI